MRIWPVILDSRPAYLQSAEDTASLLLAPIGTRTLLEHVRSSFASITGNSPVVIAPDTADADYRRRIQAACPAVGVIERPEECDDVFASCELSDAFLIVDPRCLAVSTAQLSGLTREYSGDPRVAHYLVAFEMTAGTKERVNFDAGGQVRGIHRYYEQATWPFIKGIMATVVPVACGAIGNGLLPRSLTELRQLLTARHVPNRDLPIEGGALDLTDERGMLAANELFALQAASVRQKGDDGPILIGGGHSIHPDARLVGPIVIHPDVHIAARATVLGPAVIGAGARIASEAIVAHATVCANAVVAAGEIVRDQVWTDSGAGSTGDRAERPALSYDERLSRLSIAPPQSRQSERTEETPAHRVHLFLKRALDIAAAALSLAVLSPVLLLSCVAVWLESRGPVFFGDKREGEGGRVFRCWKFRTMYSGAHLAQQTLNGLDQTDGPHFKMDRDPRVTRVGRVLRGLNVDELPQLFNVLVGEMSLVGPRPSPFRENQVCVPWREARLSVRPGITGFWQVCRHDRASGDFHQWIEYDMLYVQHMSVWLDVKILAATLLTLGGKATHVPAAWLVRPAAADRLTISKATHPQTREGVAA